MIRPLATALSALILCASPALADPFNININNGESVTLLLTVNDMNYPNPRVAYSGNISSGQVLAVVINGDTGGGGGHIQWTASTTDRSKCGSGDLTGLGTGNNVTVNAPSSC